jgi:protein-tyrosine phosphatase
LTVALRGPADASAFWPDLSPLAGRLARRCWPGPVTLAFPLPAAAPPPGGPWSQLPESVRGQVCPGEQLWLRSPGHAAILHVLRQMAEPVVMTSGPCPGTSLLEANQIAATLGDEVALIVDDGPARSDKRATVVGIDGPHWRIVREGVVPADAIGQVSAILIVFVCTGNTCRSPLAEAICKRLLADRLGCAAEELPRRGFVVLSAGVAVMMSLPAAEEAVRLAAAYGIDLNSHTSQALSEELAAQADYLLTMTQNHLEMVRGAFSELACQPRLLGSGGEDIADPIGGDREVYEACAGQIRASLEAFLAGVS